MAGDLCTAPRIILLSSLSLATDVTDATLGASGLWLGTRTGGGGTATLTESIFGHSPWLHGQQVEFCFKYDLLNAARPWWGDFSQCMGSMPACRCEEFR